MIGLTFVIVLIFVSKSRQRRWGHECLCVVMPVFTSRRPYIIKPEVVVSWKEVYFAVDRAAAQLIGM